MNLGPQGQGLATGPAEEDLSGVTFRDQAECPKVCGIREQLQHDPANTGCPGLATTKGLVTAWLHTDIQPLAPHPAGAGKVHKPPEEETSLLGTASTTVQQNLRPPKPRFPGRNLLLALEMAVMMSVLVQFPGSALPRVAGGRREERKPVPWRDRDGVPLLHASSSSQHPQHQGFQEATPSAIY